MHVRKRYTMICETKDIIRDNHISKMAEAFDIFNPLILEDISETEIITILYYMADKLIHFKCTEFFTEDFIRRFKKKCLVLLRHQNRTII